MSKILDKGTTCPPRAVVRSLAILEFLAEHGRAHVLDISRFLSLPRSSAYVLLAGLAAMDYVRKDREGVYLVPERMGPVRQVQRVGVGRDVEAVERALQILRILAQQKASRAAISDAIKSSEEATASLLRVLETSGFVEIDLADGASYRLGPQVFQLSHRGRHDSLMDVAVPTLQALARQTRETVKLAIPSEGEAVVLYAIESPRMLRTHGDVRVGAPMYCTAVGKALLAFLPEEEIGRVLRGPLRRYTHATITRRGVLGKELEVTRQRGWSLDDEENELQVRCVGAPILGPGGTAVASISVSGPTGRLTDRTIKRFSRLAVAAAREISSRVNRQDMYSEGR